LQSKHKQTMEVYNYQYFVTYFVILNSITAQNFDKKDVLEEIFGSGQSSNDNPSNFYGYISSSTEDLIKLFNHEKYYVAYSLHYAHSVNGTVLITQLTRKIPHLHIHKLKNC